MASPDGRLNTPDRRRLAIMIWALLQHDFAADTSAALIHDPAGRCRPGGANAALEDLVQDWYAEEEQISIANY